MKPWEPNPREALIPKYLSLAIVELHFPEKSEARSRPLPKRAARRRREDVALQHPSTR